MCISRSTGCVYGGEDVMHNPDTKKETRESFCTGCGKGHSGMKREDWIEAGKKRGFVLRGGVTPTAVPQAAELPLKPKTIRGTAKKTRIAIVEPSTIAK